MVTLPKNLYILLIIVAVFVVIQIYLSYLGPGELPPLAKSDARVIFHFDSQRRIFDGPVTDGLNIFDALLSASRAGRIPFEYVTDPRGLYVSAINGLANETSQVWHYFLNGKESSPEALAKKLVKPGDIIKAKLKRE